MTKKLLGSISLILLACAAAPCHEQSNFQMEVLVGGVATPKYWHGGKVYVEAVKGQEYSIRLSNPLNTRVAVALSVDGLNSIDARTTDAFSAKKWVLGPYETITIDGWQVNQRQARKFFFTTEAKSYGQWLGKTQNLGIITAVVYRERVRWDEYQEIRPTAPKEDSFERGPSSSDGGRDAPQRQAGAASKGFRRQRGHRRKRKTTQRLELDEELNMRSNGSRWSWSPPRWRHSTCVMSFGLCW